MKKGYIVIKVFEQWAKDDDAMMAIMKLTGRVWKNKEDTKNMRLIEVTYPDPQSDDDDIIFRDDGGYTLKGKAEAIHFDGQEINAFIAEIEKKERDHAEQHRK